MHLGAGYGLSTSGISIQVSVVLYGDWQAVGRLKC
jgi:hypothetical protein